MTEEEKLDAGLYYDFWDAGVNGRKLNAIKFCRELRKMQDADATEDEQAVLIKKYFGSVGSDVCLCPGFMCDSGKNIHVGDQFLANYNVTILDIMPVHIQMEPEVELLERRERSDLVKKSGPSMDGHMSAQCSVVEVSKGKDSRGEYSVEPAGTHAMKYQLDNEVLTVFDYEKLVGKYGKNNVDGVIRRILGKPYHGCLNVSKISEWCKEQQGTTTNRLKFEAVSKHSEQLSKLAKERVGD